MDGDDQQPSTLRDATRWAVSFMARLFTGDAPAQLPAEEGAFSGVSSLYRSISTVEEDVEPDGELGADADESSEEQLLAGDEGEDPRRTRSVCERSLVNHGGVLTNIMSSKAHELRRRHSTGAALRSGDASMEMAESEPLVFRRGAGKLANDVVETMDHPFGCGRREESSSLLLLSS